MSGTTFAALALGSPQEANARVRNAAAEVKQMPFAHRGVVAPLPHRVDDGVAYLIEALWLHAESARRERRRPIETATPERIATFLHVLAWERCRFAVLVARLKTLVRVTIKTRGVDRVFGSVVDILGSLVGQQLNGQVLQGLLRASGRREERGKFEQAALDQLVKTRVADAIGGVAERMDAQGLTPDDVIADDPEMHLLAQLYITGRLTFK